MIRPLKSLRNPVFAGFFFACLLPAPAAAKSRDLRPACRINCMPGQYEKLPSCEVEFVASGTCPADKNGKCPPGFSRQMIAHNPELKDCDASKCTSRCKSGQKKAAP